MKRLPPHATHAQRVEHLKVWRDYTRLRNKPLKACVKCHKTFENTDKNFARGASGWLTSTCKRCSEAYWAREHQEQAQGHKTPVCPVCRERGRPLVRDTKAPEIVWLCRRCLQASNMHGMLDTFQRFILYVLWKNQWSAGVSVPRPPAFIDPQPDDDPVDDPMGEPDNYPMEDVHGD
jgi:hypothetical protein